MSIWKELCEKYFQPPSMNYDGTTLMIIKRSDFDKIRALVKATQDFNIKYRYSGKLSWIPALDRMDDALKELGVGDAE